MPYLTVSEEAIAAENNLKNRVTELHKDLLTASKSLITTFDENKQGLGYHYNDIKTLLEALANDSSDTAHVKKLVRRLKLASMNRQIHMDMNQYGTSGGRSK